MLKLLNPLISLFRVLLKAAIFACFACAATCFVGFFVTAVVSFFYELPIKTTPFLFLIVGMAFAAPAVFCQFLFE